MIIKVGAFNNLDCGNIFAQSSVTLLNFFLTDLYIMIYNQVNVFRDCFFHFLLLQLYPTVHALQHCHLVQHGQIRLSDKLDQVIEA